MELTVENNKVITQLIDQDSALVTLIKAAEQPLAEQNDGSISGASLLAVDSAGSVLCFKNTKREGKCGYSVYGCGPLYREPLVLGFNGEFLERRTSRYSLGLGYREYDARLMRFLSPDRISPFGAGGLNAYSYCAGDPVNYHDPSGQARKWRQYLICSKKLEGQHGQVEIRIQKFKIAKLHYDNRMEKLRNEGSERNGIKADLAYENLKAAKAELYRSQKKEEFYRLEKAKARYPEHSAEAIKQKLAKKPNVSKFDPETYTDTPPWLLTYPSDLARRARALRGALTGWVRALVTGTTGPNQP